MDRLRTVLAALVGREDGDLDRVRPHVATLDALAALGWHVTEIRPDRDAPVLWRVEIKRYDGAVAIVVLDAADPDAGRRDGRTGQPQCWRAPGSPHEAHGMGNRWATPGATIG